MNLKKQAFTLVELIVVITILAILGTIAFISLNGYSSQSRDATRISDLSTMKTSLELFNLDAGKYPVTTNGFVVTYSGSTVWTQGTFGETTKTSVDKLDKIPTDPLINKEYTYSITNTKQEYQLSGIMEGDNIVLNQILLNQTNAGESTATAVVTGNYNGKILKTNSGTTCAILSVPSIISSQSETVTNLVDILTSTGLVYNGYKNLASNFKGSKFKTGGGFEFTTKKLIVYSDSNECKPLYNSTNNTARTTLIINLQTAYSGTIIENNGGIKELVNLDINNAKSLDSFGSTLVNNDLGGKITTSNILICDSGYIWNNSTSACDLDVYTVSGSFGSNANGATINVCGANVIADASGVFTTIRNYGTTCNNITATRAGYICNTTINGLASLTSNVTNIEGNCSISIPACTGAGQIKVATSTYSGCNTADTIECTGNGIGYIISACNVGSSTSGTGFTSIGNLFQWGRNKGFPGADAIQEPIAIDGSIGLNALTDTYNFVWNWDTPLPGFTWASTNIDDNWGDISNTNIARQGPCASGYHIPTQADWALMVTAGGWSTGTGMINALKMPPAGNINSDNGHFYGGVNNIHAFYWSSTIDNSTYPYALYFYTASSINPAQTLKRAWGASIRCIKN